MIPAGEFRDLRFNWYLDSDRDSAFGTLYLLNAEYLGYELGLRSSSSLVAQTSRIENGQYVFDSTLTIAGPLKYWFYTDKQGPVVVDAFADAYKEGDGYITTSSTLPFRRLTAPGSENQMPPIYVDLDFRLTGTWVVK
ncbi:MAG TPA: hypothetical protein VN700_01715 [Vicinamibacterales bacterium]|nr:hypothetical protein [Vicinamibacterales bacterium]